MPAKIRLQRHGKKRHAFFHVVIADSRAPRDGKFIEKIGTYNPNTNPATIELNTDKALEWLKNGAQPTDTARALLSYTGVLYRNHLDKGVAKGALTQEEADAKFEKWLEEKTSKIESKKDGLNAQKEEAKNKRLAAEKELNEKKAQEVMAKNSDLSGEVEEEAETEAATEEASEEAPAEVEAAATEEAAAEEAPTAEEAPAAEEASEEEETKSE